MAPVETEDDPARPWASYGFPGTPYATQQELMDKVHSVLEDGGVGIFESPTGTGKTLALLCPAVHWLQTRERSLLEERLRKETTGQTCDEDAIDDWALEHKITLARDLARSTWQRRLHQRSLRRSRAKKVLALTPDGSLHRDKIRRTAHLAPLQLGEAEFSLEEPPWLPMPEDLDENVDEPAVQDAFKEKIQIIYCSRTHSQLAQVLGEIRRIPPNESAPELSVVTLGARSNLCVNDTLRARARGSAAHLNELCRLATDRDLCALKMQSRNLADACSSTMMDMEGMVQRGRMPLGGGCPYYGSRAAAPEADVLLVPYSSLVNSRLREKLGLRTEGNILIFDEAHNLLEAISDSNSVTVTLPQARSALDDLQLYASKYEKRLNPGNAMRLRQLTQFCAKVHSHIASLTKSSSHTIGGFLVELGADNFDLPQLSRFMEDTELSRKVRGYAESLRVGHNGSSASSSGASIYSVAELLSALLHSTAEDRILCQAPTLKEGGGAKHRPAGSKEVEDEPCLKYLSLDAESRFRDILTSARTVIFAGGTLEPRAEFAPLYSGALKSQISHFAGRHIVASDQLFARFVTHGPNGSRLDFRRDNRDSVQREELMKMLASVAHATPGGCVVFFPSFEFLGSVAPPASARLGGREVFVESRGSQALQAASGCEPRGLGRDQVLPSFAAAVQRDGGAVLLAVCGGKLSEGINFADRLCRLVIVVGLPYPNASDLTLLEKMKFLDACRAKGLPGLTGRDFYSARCMKGVNQCIGRSIRHAQDWAAVLLLDHRYAQPNIAGAISAWIREDAKAGVFGNVDVELASFFAARTRSACAASATR